MPGLFRRRGIVSRRPTHRHHVSERLERRQLFTVSAQTLLNDGYVPIQSNGQQNWAKAGQWLVEFDSTSTRSLTKLNSSLVSSDLNAGARFTKSLGDNQSYLVTTDRYATLDDVRASLEGLPHVKAIEPDFAIFPAAITSNDPELQNQWALTQSSDHDIDAPEAWELATGSSAVVIGVPDSGIDYNHPDLSSNVWKNYAEIAGNGIDDDLNGFIDDVRGWDWVNNDNNPIDDHGHGTVVAGEIGAIGNNSVGISGVAWQVKLMPLKFIASTGLGTSSGAMLGMNYALAQKKAGVNVRAINASWINNNYSQIFEDTITQLGANGILFIAGAGNGGVDGIGDDNDEHPTFPASYYVDNVIAVAATDKNDQLAGFSNYGPMTVALAAPGVGIESTGPGNTYTWSTGTSDSAPFVSGVVALAAAAAPTATAAQIRSALIAGADPIPSLTGKVLSNGRLNARKTLELLLPLTSGDGVSATYFDDPGLSGATVSRIDPNIGFDWSSNAPVNGISPRTYSVRWTGSIMPATTENYTLYTRADDGVRLWIDGNLIINRWTDRPLFADINEDGIINTGDFNVLAANFGRIRAVYQDGDINGDGAVTSLDAVQLFANWGKTATAQEDSVTIQLTAGQKHAIQMDYYQNVGRATAKLLWSSSSVPKQIVPQSRLFSTMPAGFTPVQFESEGVLLPT
jgi:subtilisin family serine protease